MKSVIWLMYIAAAKRYILNAARKSDKMLEPYEWKRSRTVLREERGSNAPDLLDYVPLIQNLGGELVKLSASSQNHINAMDISDDVTSDENPISIKSEFLISLFDQLLKNGDTRFGGGVGAKDRSIIDRCTINVYSKYFNGKSEVMPTLADFREELLRQPEKEAHDLALSLELFATGSLDAFAHQSNVNVKKPL